MTETAYYDITIIGGGPVGLFAATYARMRLAKTQIIESLDQLGGQVSTLFPAKKIYDIPGFYEISGEDLIKNFEKQTLTFKPDIFLGETVLGFEKTPEGFLIKTSKRTTYSRSIIIAAGIGAFEPRRLTLDNASQLEGKQLRYFVTDPTTFAGKDLAIAGGGDSAIDWALTLYPQAKSVHLIHRRDKFRALESNLAKLKETKTNFETPYTIKELSPAATDKLTITLQKVRSQETKTITVDHLLVNYGFVSDNKIISSWGLEMQNRAIKVNQAQETNIPGVYAIGDSAYHEGKIDLIATGLGEAPNAVNNALLYVYPEKRQPAHSTQLIKAFNQAQKK